MSSDTDYGAGWDAGYAEGYEDGKCAWMLTHEAVTARVLSGWRVRDVPPGESVWYLMWGPGAREREPELMTKSEVEIVRSVLATLHKDSTP